MSEKGESRKRRLKRLILFNYCINCDEWDLDLTIGYCPVCGSNKLELMEELSTVKLIEYGVLQIGDRVE